MNYEWKRLIINERYRFMLKFCDCKIWIIAFFLSVAFHLKAGNSQDLEVIFDLEPIFEKPVSQLATEQQFYSADFSKWCAELKEPLTLHRQIWSWCYIAQVLKNEEMLEPGKCGLGFGVGNEPLPALFANYGCSILATDIVKPRRSQINIKNICAPQQFKELVKVGLADMNRVEPYLQDYDFVWSSTSAHLLGDIGNGFQFMRKSLDCLKPGGVAVHTFEYNLSSNWHSVTKGPIVIFRRYDLIHFLLGLIQEGYEVYPLNLNQGGGTYDAYIDQPPYNSNYHIKLAISNLACTYMGIVIKKPANKFN